jgi:Stage II sporulation protein E (SpoIIE)
MKSELDYSLYVRSYPGSPLGGDTGVIVPNEEGALVALVDATGHGLMAYGVAMKARATILSHTEAAPDELLLLLDKELRGTDGAAISIVRVRGHQIEFSGIGNVSVRVNEQQFLPKIGIVGYRMRTPVLSRAKLPRGSWLLLHTDGVSTPGALPRGSARTVARALVEECGSMQDDAAVLALRWQEKILA